MADDQSVTDTTVTLKLRDGTIVKVATDGTTADRAVAKLREARIPGADTRK